MGSQYFIQKWNHTIFPLGPEYDQLALLQTSAYANIFGVPMVEMGNHKVEGLLKITYNKKSIYKKYVGNNDFPEDNSVIINYRSLAELGINPKDIGENLTLVNIEPASALEYLWHNSYAHIRKPFQWAIISLLLTIILGMISIVIELISLHC